MESGFALYRLYDECCNLFADVLEANDFLLECSCITVLDECSLRKQVWIISFAESSVTCH